jgi:hypothetical protein
MAKGKLPDRELFHLLAKIFKGYRIAYISRVGIEE